MSKTVMIVDDSATVRQVVGLALKGAGYSVVEAGDGKDALGKLDGQKIHLVISDVNMPEMDGLSFVRAMKQKDAYKFVPVIMLTTEGNEAIKAVGKDIGVKAWMVKPFQPQQMLAGVSKLLM